MTSAVGGFAALPDGSTGFGCAVSASWWAADSRTPGANQRGDGAAGAAGQGFAFAALAGSGTDSKNASTTAGLSTDEAITLDVESRSADTAPSGSGEDWMHAFFLPRRLVAALFLFMCLAVRSSGASAAVEVECIVV